MEWSSEAGAKSADLLHSRDATTPGASRLLPFAFSPSPHPSARGSVDVLIRLACIIIAVAIARMGIVEESPALIVVATAILGLALMGVSSARADDVRRLKTTV